MTSSRWLVRLPPLGVHNRQAKVRFADGRRTGGPRHALMPAGCACAMRKTVIDYTYDFGDCWEHRLTVTDVRAGEPDVSYPRYVGGERNGPPEDCGGIPGFYGLLEALADSKHPDHADAKQWSADYDPNTFDELPIKFALGRIANRRNAARSRLAKKKPLGSAA
jgi:hypothetical protein